MNLKQHSLQYCCSPMHSRTIGLNLMKLFCQHLSPSLSLFPELMASHNLRQEGPLGIFTRAVSFLGSYSSCLLKFFPHEQLEQKPILLHQLPIPNRPASYEETLHICLLSLFCYPRAFLATP